jgi:hypothetical protein
VTFLWATGATSQSRYVIWSDEFGIARPIDQQAFVGDVAILMRDPRVIEILGPWRIS